MILLDRNGVQADQGHEENGDWAMTHLRGEGGEEEEAAAATAAAATRSVDVGTSPQQDDDPLHGTQPTPQPEDEYDRSAEREPCRKGAADDGNDGDDAEAAVAFDAPTAQDTWASGTIEKSISIAVAGNPIPSPLSGGGGQGLYRPYLQVPMDHETKVFDENTGRPSQATETQSVPTNVASPGSGTIVTGRTPADGSPTESVPDGPPTSNGQRLPPDPVPLPATPPVLARSRPKPKGSEVKVGPLYYLRFSDGQVLRASCLDCDRAEYSGVQGLLNHCRLAHGRAFKNHDDLITECGRPVQVDENGDLVGFVRPRPDSSSSVHPFNRPVEMTGQAMLLSNGPAAIQLRPDHRDLPMRSKGPRRSERSNLTTVVLVAMPPPRDGPATVRPMPDRRGTPAPLTVPRRRSERLRRTDEVVASTSDVVWPPRVSALTDHVNRHGSDIDLAAIVSEVTQRLELPTPESSDGEDEDEVTAEAAAAAADDDDKKKKNKEKRKRTRRATGDRGRKIKRRRLDPAGPSTAHPPAMKAEANETSIGNLTNLHAGRPDDVVQTTESAALVPYPAAHRPTEATSLSTMNDGQVDRGHADIVALAASARPTMTMTGDFPVTAVDENSAVTDHKKQAAETNDDHKKQVAETNGTVKDGAPSRKDHGVGGVLSDGPSPRTRNRINVARQNQAVAKDCP